MTTERVPTALLWHWGRRGGGPRYTLELARAMADRDDIRTHLSHSRQAEIAADFAALGLPGPVVDTYSGPIGAALGTFRLPGLIHRFGRHIRTHAVDAVVCTMDHPWNPVVVPAIHPAGARYILTVHDAVAHPGEESRLRRWALRRQLAVADGVVALTDHVRDQLAAVHGYPLERVTVLPHGVFRFGAASPRRAPTNRPMRLLFFGRILPYKGLDLLLEAYRLLRAENPAGGARPVTLRIAGAGDLSAHTDALATLPDVTVDNRWFGEDEIARVLADADLLVLPYREASQSGPAVSACGAALPVVATPVGGLSEQIIDGRTGLLARAPTAEGIAEAIAAVTRDPALYAALSTGALAHADGALSWNPIADGFVDMIRRTSDRPMRGMQGVTP